MRAWAALLWKTTGPQGEPVVFTEMLPNISGSAPFNRGWAARILDQSMHTWTALVSTRAANGSFARPTRPWTTNSVPAVATFAGMLRR